MKTRVIRNKIYDSVEFEHLKNEEKYLVVFLCTNPFISQIPIHRLSDKKLLYYLGWTQRRLDEVKKKLEKLRLAFFYGGYVLIFDKYATYNYSGPLNLKAQEGEWADIPPDIKAHFESMDTSIDTYINTSIDTLKNKKSEIRNNKSQIRKNKSQIRKNKSQIRKNKSVEENEDVDPSEIPF